jgi:hypothetical protein
MYTHACETGQNVSTLLTTVRFQAYRQEVTALADFSIAPM